MRFSETITRSFMRSDEEKKARSKQKYLSAEYLMKNIDSFECLYTRIYEKL